MNQIKAKALFHTERGNDEILVFENVDRVKNETYYRPIGGTVEFGEKTIETVVREVLEETGEEIVVKELLLVEENVFTCDGVDGHEIVFIYSGKFKRNRLVEMDEFWITESNGEKIKCKWIEKSLFASGKLRLVPKGMLSII